MDALDLEIIRWMYPRGAWSSWGIDPRIRHQDIARRVGISREALWSRFRAWQREGFLRSTEIYPNVRLFGVHRYRVDLQVKDPAEATRVLDALESLEGVIAAWTIIGDSTSARGVQVVVAHIVGPPNCDGERWREVLRRATGVTKVDGPFSEQPPAVTRRLTPLDWRILAELRSVPPVPVPQMSARLGVSSKTFLRHRNALLDSNAISYLPEFKWALLPSALFALFFAEHSDRARIMRYVSDHFVHYLPSAIDLGVEGECFMGEDFHSLRWSAVRVPCSSQSEVHNLAVGLSKIPGVTRVYNEVWGPNRWYHKWLELRLARTLEVLARKKDAKEQVEEIVPTPWPLEGVMPETAIVLDDPAWSQERLLSSRPPPEGAGARQGARVRSNG